jgi:asparagine synthase (glutamine-hydrolysing)
VQALGWKPRRQQSAVNGQRQNPKQSMTNDSMTIDQLINDQLTIDLMTNDYFSPTGIASEAKQSLSALQYISYVESCAYMRNQLLRDSDVFSMTHSLELRVPFVDHLLYGSVLPYLDYGFDKSFPKKILVDAVGDLPDEIVHRPKQGFTFPFEDWIRNGKMKESINDCLTSSKMTNYFNKNALVNLQKDFEQNKIHWSRVWTMYVSNNFLQ